MSEARALLLVVVLSFLIFIFIQLVLGNDIPEMGERLASKSCGPGAVYSEYSGKCKDLVNSNKRLSERLSLLIPYFAAHAESNRN